MKKKQEDLYYVEINEPVGIRKDVLISTKDILDALRRYEKYTAVKKQKQQAVAQLKKTVDELLVLNKRLRSKLPKAPKSSIPAREKEEPAPHRHEARPQSKLELLERELADIEGRLSSLE